MGYSLSIWAIATFIESRVKFDIQYAELEKVTGFSYRHIREIFKECTGISLSKYILERRLANAAFDIVHSRKKLTDIAYEYKFNSYDSFTRAFKRHVKVLPSEFRNKSYKVGRRRMLMGMYAPVIHKDEDITYLQPRIREDLTMNKETKKTEDSCILYGVPKVTYSFEECTPFPVALKACLNYMGQKIDYTYIMAVSGAAFRLRWNKQFWDDGNVDIMNIYEDEYEAFKRSFKGVGRECKILKRENSSKEDFINFIKSQIDEGRPVIALGIIGPPEACLVTGYRESGNILLGWNCFQDNKEFAKGIKIDDSGYYICDNWWENKDTIALMSIGENQHSKISQKSIIKNAINIMTKDNIFIKSKDGKVERTYAGGQLAYDLWAKSITDDREFTDNAIIPILIERLICQGDAQAMIREGRSYAACFIEWIGKSNNHVAQECIEAANQFRAVAQCSFDMNKLRGGLEQTEKILNKFLESEVRKETASLVLKAKQHEYQACEQLKKVYNKL